MMIKSNIRTTVLKAYRKALQQNAGKEATENFTTFHQDGTICSLKVKH